jgi:hypothetical protein
MDKADQVARQVAESLRRDPNDLDAIVSASDAAARELEASGHDLRTLLPAGEEVGLGFRGGKRPGGRSIVRAFRDALHDDLCNPKADLHKRVGAAVNAGGIGLVALLVGALGLPAVASALIAPLGGAILGVGLKAYCRTINKI